MKGWLWLAMAATALLSTGFFIVPANEKRSCDVLDG